MELRLFDGDASTLEFEFYRGCLEMDRLFFIGFLRTRLVILFSKT